MALATNLHRRGAVYNWRRRVPATFALATGAELVEAQLEDARAGSRALPRRPLDATAADLFMTTLPIPSRRKQLATLYRKAFLGHEVKLDRVAAFARQEPDFDPAAEMAAEQPWLELSGRL